VPDFPLAVDSKIQCENLNQIINELLKGLLFHYFLLNVHYNILIEHFDRYDDITFYKLTII
jgi:hypothetical protein